MDWEFILDGFCMGIFVVFDIIFVFGNFLVKLMSIKFCIIYL